VPSRRVGPPAAHRSNASTSLCVSPCRAGQSRRVDSMTAPGRATRRTASLNAVNSSVPRTAWQSEAAQQAAVSSASPPRQQVRAGRHRAPRPGALWRTGSSSSWQAAVVIVPLAERPTGRIRQMNSKQPAVARGPGGTGTAFARPAARSSTRLSHQALVADALLEVDAVRWTCCSFRPDDLEALLRQAGLRKSKTRCPETGGRTPFEQ